MGVVLPMKRWVCRWMKMWLMTGFIGNWTHRAFRGQDFVTRAVYTLLNLWLALSWQAARHAGHVAHLTAGQLEDRQHLSTYTWYSCHGECFGKSMHVQGMRKPEKKSSLLICKWLRDDKTLAPKVANTKFHMTTSKVYNKSFSRHQKSFEISIDSKIFAQNISVHLFAYLCLKICFLILLALTSCKFSCSLFYLRLVVGANSFRGLQNF